MLQVRLLGPLEVTDDSGRPLTPGGIREQLCLATLAVLAPNGVSTERLAAELYHDRSTTDPRNAVQAVVSRLRRALGQAAGAVETTAAGYRLVDVALDVDAADELLRATLAAPDPHRGAELLGQANALWRGPFLDGLDGGAAVEAERVRIDALRDDAEDAVAEQRLAAQPTPEPALVAELDAATRSQPWRERRWELLMLALYRQGRQADALRAYQRARRLLAGELGLEPGPSLASLERRILDHDPTLLAAAPPPPSPAAGTGAAPEALPSGTLSLLLCDAVGSVRQWEAAPADTARAVGQLHELWTEAVGTHQGTVVKSTGDGVLAVFPTAALAIRAAATAVRAQARTVLTVRVAIHAGSLAPTGNDYRGPVVNRCARLLELAHGGQILVSGPAAELARADLSRDDPSRDDPAERDPGNGDQELGLRDLGLHWLRDVAEPTPVWQVTGPELPAAFPALRTAGSPASLPRPRSALVGRAELVAEVVAQVETHPLVTLIGPGGIGKTSVALTAAWEATGHRPVTFVDLATVQDPRAVPERLAHELAPADRDDHRDPVERIADRLRAGLDLVVVDNAEHVLDAVATTVDAVLHHDLKGSLLVTSRQPLGLTGEAIIGIPPLDLPDHDDDLESTGRSPSVQLFLARAQSARTDGSAVAVPPGLLPLVAHICRRLDGIPLAIELAAGRASMLSLEDIAARLDDQLRLLRQTRSSRARRHRSLEAVVSWSVEQLTPSARRLFGRLAVMAGGFDLEGAEAFASRCGMDPDDVLSDLDELHGASLVVAEAGGRDHGTWFRLLEPIRQVAAADLEAAGAAAATREAHALWLSDLVGEASRRRDDSRTPAYARIDGYGDQLRAAVSWIADNERADLAPGIAFGSAWWFLTRDTRAGARLLHRLLDLVDREANPLGWATVVLANAIVTVTHPRSEVTSTALEAVAVFDANDHPDADLARVVAAFAQTGGTDSALPRRLLREAEAMAAGAGSWTQAVVDMSIMAMDGIVSSVEVSPGLLTEAIDRGERAAAVFRRMGEPWARGVTLSELGRLHHLVGDLERAEACYLESLGLLDDANYHGSHFVYSALGRLASTRGDHDRAQRYHQRALEVAELDANPNCVAFALAGLASAAEDRGQPALAADLYRQALDHTDAPSLVNHAQGDWRQALERLQRLRSGPDR